jgi:hypothetical protein
LVIKTLDTYPDFSNFFFDCAIERLQFKEQRRRFLTAGVSISVVPDYCVFLVCVLRRLFVRIPSSKFETVTEQKSQF